MMAQSKAGHGITELAIATVECSIDLATFRRLKSCGLVRIGAAEGKRDNAIHIDYSRLRTSKSM